MGFLTVPKVNHCTGLILLIVNCIFPGVGTMIGSIISSTGCDLCILLCGVVQLLTAPFIIGWIWSIIWGCKMCTLCVCLETILKQHADGTHKSLVVELDGEMREQEVADSHPNPLEENGCKGCGNVHPRLV